MQLACVCPFQIFQNFPLQCSQVECLLDTDEMDDSPLLFTLSDVGQHGITVRSGWISHRQGWMNTCFKHNFIQVETLARTPWFKRDVKIGWSSLRIFTFLGAQICGRFKSGAQIGRQRPENWALHFYLLPSTQLRCLVRLSLLISLYQTLHNTFLFPVIFILLPNQMIM